MSAIDTLEHAHVKNFFGIPVYWILEESKMNYLTDNILDTEKINKFNLSIGGGSGEHSALIINNDSVILNFLEKIQKTNFDSNSYDNKIYALYEKLENKYLSNSTLENIFNWKINQNNWPLEAFFRIDSEIKKIHTSKDPLQTKIMDAIAVLIIYTMPLQFCIQDPDIVEVCKIIRQNKWNNVLNKTENLSYLSLFNDFGDVKFGKIVKNKETFFGYSLDDWKKDHQSLELFDDLSSEITEKKERNNKIKI